MNPLDQLADINLPQTVSYWPLAAGYWILLGVICLLAALLIIWSIKYQSKNKAKKKALADFKKLNLDDPDFVPKTQIILKTAVAHYRGIDTASKSYGKIWSNVLTSLYKGKEPEKIELLASYLYESLYFVSGRKTDSSSLELKNGSVQNSENASSHEHNEDLPLSKVREIALDWLKNLDISEPSSEQFNRQQNPFGATKC